MYVQEYTIYGLKIFFAIKVSLKLKHCSVRSNPIHSGVWSLSWFTTFGFGGLTLDILFSSNHNIHKSLWGLWFWASDPLFDIFK